MAFTFIGVCEMSDWSVSYYQRDKSRDEKFWEKVDIKGKEECWNWLASKNKKGYGNFYVSIGNSKDKHWSAHRMAWTLEVGKIPKGMQVLHHCDNPACVNPDHLFLGTNQDNVDDKMKKGRHGRLLGESNPASKLTEEDVKLLRKLRAEQNYTYERLGKMFNVNRSTAHDAVNNYWKHI